MIYVVALIFFLDWLLLERLGLPLAIASWVPLALLAAFAYFERRRPHRPEYRQGVQGTWTDVGFVVWTQTVMNVILGLTIAYGLVPFVARLRALAGLSPTWGIGALHLYVQVLIGWLLITFGDYWVHRLAHGPLWPVHKLHHMTPQLGVLKWTLSHPLEILLVVQLRLLPMLLLGMSGRAVEHVAFLQLTFGIPVHANVAFAPFPGGIFTSIHQHEIHHGTDPAEEHSNFGVLTLLWDHVFGTYRAPRAAWRPVGIHSDVFRTERDYRRVALRYVLTPWKGPPAPAGHASDAPPGLPLVKNLGPDLRDAP